MTVKNFINKLLFTPGGGCVFYAPLWWSESNGATFSERISSATCTVSGATWGTTGYTFDGTNDKIQCDTVAGSSFFDSAHTLAVWVSLTAWAANRTCICGCKSDLSAYSLINFETSTKKFTANVNQGGVGENKVSTSGTYNNNSDYHFLAMTVDADGHINHFCVDGTDMGDDDTYDNDLSAADTFQIGTLTGTTNPWKGVVAIALVYNRELSTTEIEDIRQRTLWRYG